MAGFRRRRSCPENHKAADSWSGLRSKTNSDQSPPAAHAPPGRDTSDTQGERSPHRIERFVWPRRGSGSMSCRNRRRRLLELDQVDGALRVRHDLCCGVRRAGRAQVSALRATYEGRFPEDALKRVVDEHSRQWPHACSAAPGCIFQTVIQPTRADGGRKLSPTPQLHCNRRRSLRWHAGALRYVGAVYVLTTWTFCRTRVHRCGCCVALYHPCSVCSVAARPTRDGRTDGAEAVTHVFLSMVQLVRSFTAHGCSVSPRGRWRRNGWRAPERFV